jgi:phage shock protein C
MVPHRRTGQAELMENSSQEPLDPNSSRGGWPGKRVYRSRKERMVAGVCGGLAEYFGIDPTIVRLAFVASAFLGGAGLVAYVVAWVIIPEA